MSSLPDAYGPPSSYDELEIGKTLDGLDTDVAAAPRSSWPRRLQSRLAALDSRWKYPIAVYAASRVIYLALALVDTIARRDEFSHHWSLAQETANWDGVWYLTLATHGYPSHLSGFHYSTLGFFPLYPILIWVVGHVAGIAYVWSGLIIAMILGAVTTLLVARLAEQWFGPSASRRATLFFCLFPGSIVFSMDYTEGLLLALIAGALLAVHSRRWLWGGLLAGLSTAVGPVAVAILPAAAAVSVRELHRHGWRDPGARRSLLLPLLAPLGIIAFGAYLWVHVGTPFASYITQRNAWHEHSGPLALYFQAHYLVREIFTRVPGTPANLNAVVGLFGAGVLAWGLIHMWRARQSVPLMALVWTVGVAFLTVTSDQVPPNPRMLLCAFPMLIVLAARLEGRAYRRLIAITSLSLVVLSAVTFVGTGLRP